MWKCLLTPTLQVSTLIATGGDSITNIVIIISSGSSSSSSNITTITISITNNTITSLTYWTHDGILQIGLVHCIRCWVGS